ncbi:hypothetical protein M569_16596, partial [Genlisea aurea]
SSESVSAPTAPWMRKPLFVNPSQLLDLRKSPIKKNSFNKQRLDKDLSEKVGNGRNKLAMRQIFRGIKKLQESRPSSEAAATEGSPKNFEFKFRPGELSGNPQDSKNDGCERNSETTDGFCIPLREAAEGEEVRLKAMPWQREAVGRMATNRPLMKAAKLNAIDELLLERLQNEAAKMRKWIKVKKLGVTPTVVDQVHSTWRSSRSQLALLKFDVPLNRCMSRAREIVEMKTGGIAIWKSKDLIAVYRGSESSNAQQSSASFSSLYERETDRLLDELGPRFVDWWLHKPLPVDADLLPQVVPGFKPPPRLCPPPFTRPQLFDDELTYLRKLARPLPTHFVLGRNNKLQGLAAAILKLWEKCHIAKIALKWGVQNTDNELMADELKRLTGGVLILRNKYLILLYRGKDFLPRKVAKAVAERNILLSTSQQLEEAARIKASEPFLIAEEEEEDSCSASLGGGTLAEFHDICTERSSMTMTEAELKKERLEKELENQQKSLSNLKRKIERSSRVLKKIKSEATYSEPDPDVEVLSNEELRSLRNLGMRNDNTLLLGRRGVYDGVIEGMHQHWKHREIVKVVTMQRKYSQIMLTAKTLEAESGGIVISVLKLKKGHAILVYRGKNYSRPKCVALNLLNKKDALSHSIERQRLGSLKFFSLQRETTINRLKRQL